MIQALPPSTAPHPPVQTVAQVVPSPATPAFDDAYAHARALANGGQPGLALAEYDALLARSPGNVDVLLGRGTVHARAGHWPEAEADLGAAAQAAPNYADVWAALGDLYTWSDRPARAVEAYGRVLALRPQDADAHVARARAYRALGRTLEARDDLAQARALGASGAALQSLETALAPAPESVPEPARESARESAPEPSSAAVRAANPDAANAAGITWAASLSSSWLDVGTGPRWNDRTLSLRRYGQYGSLGFEALQARRFGLRDQAWALDGYVDLWRGAYANVRYQRSPHARLFPANAGRAELYQSLGGGWEVSASDDVLGFAGRVNIYGATLARYTGNFYLQWRHQAIAARGGDASQQIAQKTTHGSGDRLLARWYYLGDADSYLEGSVNRGRSDDPVSLVGGRARSGGGGVTWVRYWTPQWGMRLGATVSRAGSAGDERGVSVALYRRW